MDKQKLKYWSERIGISIPRTYRIRKFQISNECQRPYRFNGYCRAEDTLYYDKEWDDAYFCHEMLHAKFPDFSEKAIKELTKIILY